MGEKLETELENCYCELMSLQELLKDANRLLKECRAPDYDPQVDDDMVEFHKGYDLEFAEKEKAEYLSDICKITRKIKRLEKYKAKQIKTNPKCDRCNGLGFITIYSQEKGSINMSCPRCVGTGKES